MERDYHKIISAVYLFLTEADKILLQRRFNTGYEDGKYSIVAGHKEENETPKEALLREVKEETGIILRCEDLEVAHIMFRKIPKNERIDIFIKAKKWSGEIKNMEPDKCDDLRWFKIDDLPENMIYYVKIAIENIQNKVFYSEYSFLK